MPVRVRDPVFGHHAIFYASSAHSSAADDVQWGPDSIEVPSSSPMNGIADVWFYLPNLPPSHRIRRWCRHANVTYLGIWQSSTTTSAFSSPPLGFGFRVPHFSRFRFNDSEDSDEHNDNEVDDKDDHQQPASVQRAGSTPARPRARRDDDDQRLRRAGNTPARPRVNTSIRPSQQQQPQSARPRMSTRVIADLDDTDPDMDDDDGDNIPGDTRHDVLSSDHNPQQYYDGAEPEQLPFDTKLLPSARHHRQIAFNDSPTPLPHPIAQHHYDPFQPIQQWPTAKGADAPSVHRLRDALFTQTRGSMGGSLLKTEPMLHDDVDMLDKTSSETPKKQDRNVITIDDVKQDDVVDDFLILAREADEEYDRHHAITDRQQQQYEEEEEQQEEQLQVEGALPIADWFSSVTLPFPRTDQSIVAGKQDLFLDNGLLLGRATRCCFSASETELVSQTFNPSRGFTLAFHNAHANVFSIDRLAISSLLKAHCATWFNWNTLNNNEDVDITKSDNDDQTSDEQQQQQRNLVVPPSSTATVSNFQEKRGVRMPTLISAFSSSSVSNSFMQLTSEALQFQYKSGGDTNAQHASIAFGLLYALYESKDKHHSTLNDASDVVDGDALDKTITDSIDELQQDDLIHRLATWATESASTVFDEDNVDDAHGLRKAVIALACGQVDTAVDIAINMGHLRLAMLISRALEVPKDELRADAEAQLEQYGLRMSDTPTSATPGDSNNTTNKPSSDFFGAQPSQKIQNTGWDRILKYCEEEANVSVDERMILLILAGHVAPVARFLRFSWYRLFTMELLYGAGSTGDDSGLQWRRVAAAVEAVSVASSIQTPHRQTQDIDIVYQLLRNFAEDKSKTTTLTPATMAQLYSNGAFGASYQPLDSRFPWLLHQTLSALIPEASPRFAPVRLSDALAAQLKGAGFALWAYYVLCTSDVPAHVLKITLLRDWPSMRYDSVQLRINSDKIIDTSKRPVNSNNGKSNIEGGEDAQGNGHGNSTGSDEEEKQQQNWTENEERRRGVQNEENGDNIGFGDDPRSDIMNMNADDFLTQVLGVPDAWIHEARALEARVESRSLDECEEWLLCRNAYGAEQCHEVLMSKLVPRAIVANDKGLLARIASMLSTIENMIASHDEDDDNSNNVLDESTSSSPPIQPPPGWTYGGELISKYLTHVAGVPRLVDATMDMLRALVSRVRTYVDLAQTQDTKCAGVIIADGILTAQRAFLMRVPLEVADNVLTAAIADLDVIPCSRAVRLRLTAEYTLITTHGWPGAQRVAGAFPAYRKYVEALGDHCQLDNGNDEAQIGGKNEQGDAYIQDVDIDDRVPGQATGAVGEMQADDVMVVQ